MSDFTMKTGDDSVAIISWDMPDKSMNVLSLEGAAELGALVDQALADEAVKGIVITSAKPEFAAGMDLNVLAAMQKGGAQSVFDGVMSLHRLLRRIELAGMDPRTRKGGKPIAAALPGSALGIGLELSLATHRIFAADDPRARIGLPEIMVGIFPGGGGTTRLVRKLGVLAAAPFLLEGKLSDPAKARAAGLIDEVVADPLAAAREWVLNASEADLVKPWDQKGFKLPGGAPYHPAGFMTYVGASAMVHGRTFGAFPAAQSLLSAVYEGALVDFDTALRIEARWFTHALMNPSAGAMIRSLFINKQALEKGANRPEAPDQSVRKLGVLGAGMMGAGIAHVGAMAGIQVVLIDSTQEAADRGKAHSAGLLDKAVSRRKSTPEKKAEVLARITATTDYAALEGCDLIVEAVFEDPAVKAEVTARAEAVIPPDAIFATNTSTLPISDLARASTRPDQFIGIHFFSPVDRMALVEIIKGQQTGPRAVAKALDFVRQIRKTPIVVNDARFFYANRCIIPYINEGLQLVTEGVRQPLIDNAARLLGFPVGPLQLVDETSLDLAARIARATSDAMGDAYTDSDADALVFWMNDLGRLGRKAGAGFFDYDQAGKRGDYWTGVTERFPHADKQPPLDEVQNRLLMVQVLEAVRALQDGVLTDIREGDVGAVLGWGFMPWSGGPFSWLDIVGAPQALAIADDLAARHGPRFEPPELLREMARTKQRFHDRFASGEDAA